MSASASLARLDSLNLTSLSTSSTNPTPSSQPTNSSTSSSSSWFGSSSSSSTNPPPPPPSSAPPSTSTTTTPSWLPWSRASNIAQPDSATPSSPEQEEKWSLLPRFLGGSSAGSGSANSSSAEVGECFALSWKQRMTGFFMCMTAGMTMLFMSVFFVQLIFIGQPAKFAISYALANVFLLSSSCFSVGPSRQFAQMFSSQRALASIVYLVSLILTLYTAWAIRSFYIVLPILFVQICSLLWYVSSYLPYGQDALKRICKWTIGRKLPLPI